MKCMVRIDITDIVCTIYPYSSIVVITCTINFVLLQRTKSFHCVKHL